MTFAEGLLGVADLLQARGIRNPDGVYPALEEDADYVAHLRYLLFDAESMVDVLRSFPKDGWAKDVSDIDGTWHMHIQFLVSSYPIKVTITLYDVHRDELLAALERGMGDLGRPSTP
jgi:hypothetical protein